MPVFKFKKSTATNPYDLLDDVVRVIRAEPLRCYMGTWSVRGARAFKALFPRMKRRPPCETAGCLAAWIVIQRDGKLPKAPTGDQLDVIPRRAEEILGSLEGGTVRLFNGTVLDQGQELRYGTRAYVDVVVDRVRRFQGKHEAALRLPFAAKK
jgi:hypothetical protein